MGINEIAQENISSLQSAIGMVMLRKSMNQDSDTINNLLQGMQPASIKVMENSVAPHKGRLLDVRV